VCCTSGPVNESGGSGSTLCCPAAHSNLWFALNTLWFITHGKFPIIGPCTLGEVPVSEGGGGGGGTVGE